jgi:hypothetical protein
MWKRIPNVYNLSGVVARGFCWAEAKEAEYGHLTAFEGHF